MPSDMQRFEPRADFARALACEGGQLPKGEKLTLMALPGRAEMAEGVGERVLGVAGLEPQPDGSLAVWACLADLTPRQWFWAAFWALRVLKAQTARRIVAIPAPTPEAVRLLKRIGFVDVGEPYMVWEG